MSYMVKNYTKLEELNGSRDRRPFLFNNTFFVFGKIALFEKYFLFKKKKLVSWKWVPYQLNHISLSTLQLVSSRDEFQNSYLKKKKIQTIIFCQMIFRKTYY